MRLLLDEHISPTLVGRLADAGVYAQSVPHAGLSGRADREIWEYALDVSTQTSLPRYTSLNGIRDSPRPRLSVPPAYLNRVLTRTA